MGGDASCYVLVYPMGVGNQPGGAAPCRYFLADPRLGRARRSRPLARVRAVVGNCGSYQYFPTGVSACLWTVDMAPTLETRQDFADGNCSSVADIRRLPGSVDCEKF